MTGTVSFVANLLVIVGLSIGGYIYIINHIEKKVKEYSERPWQIFNIDGVVVVDKGAEKYIEKITINKDMKEGSDEFTEIIVTTKSLMRNSPIIVSLDEKQIIFDEKGSGNNWIYKIYEPTFAWEDTPPSRGMPPNRYSVEIIPN